MDVLTTLQVLGFAERAAVISLSAYGLLQKAGHQDIARLILLLHDDAAETAEILGKDLGIEVLEHLDPESASRSCAG